MLHTFETSVGEVLSGGFNNRCQTLTAMKTLFHCTCLGRKTRNSSDCGRKAKLDTLGLMQL